MDFPQWPVKEQGKPGALQALRIIGYRTQVGTPNTDTPSTIVR